MRHQAAIGDRAVKHRPGGRTHVWPQLGVDAVGRDDDVGLGGRAVGERRRGPCRRSCSKPVHAMAGVHRRRRAARRPAARRDRRGACRTSRSSPRSPSPAPARSARRRGGSNASRCRPARRTSRPPAQARPAADGARCSASGTRRRRSRRARAPARRPVHRSTVRDQRVRREQAADPAADDDDRSAPSSVHCLIAGLHGSGVVSLHDDLSVSYPVAETRSAGDRRTMRRREDSMRLRALSLPCALRSALLALLLSHVRRALARGLSGPPGQNRRAVPRRRNGRRGSAACRRLAVAQMGPAGRDREPHRGCRKHRRRIRLTVRRPTATRCCRRRRRRW